MPLLHTALAKLAVGATATAILAGGAVTVAVRHDGSAKSRASRADHSAAAAIAGANGETEVVVDPITGAVRLVPRRAGASASGGAAGGANGAPGSSGNLSVGAQIDTGPFGQKRPGSVGVDVRPGGGGAGANPPGGGSSPGSGGGSGGGGGGGISVPSTPDLSTPDAASIPQNVSAHAQGGFTLAVPGTDKTTKILCLSGSAANRCQTVTVPALRPVDLTLSFSGNAGTQAPTFNPDYCPGGGAITVHGLAAGATVMVSANGRQVSAKVPERGVSQTASLCDG